ncbi:1-acyl-sn-glycerol-3-phosphate acyltransferase [Nocardioides sp. JQ2195]|uniref:lysophospholipid acyltransferase family protein n=1 Tax=Nocardioides sp. JQ2195 TaxID=2592334 RepID=UPI00143E2EC7|nr:lysophospholipid acyltransferase family protein [Nocardioides sp. JQ2195]QIX27515.1 1-acyl-sn-glycerol-3-phosphate acyltransferase [Nocardioides sp. JQ2195]
MTRSFLPDTTAVALPRRLMLHGLRPLASFIVRRRFAVRVHHADRAPVSGPVIFASNHVGVADGPLLAIFSPRPVHALTKVEMFEGRLGGFLRGAGQIPLNRFTADPSAIKTCLAVLRAGRAAGIFPEGSRGPGDFRRFHAGAAYLGLVSGAPIVPVSMIGTRAPGAGSSALPARGATVDIVYGEPFRVEQVPWPRTREQVTRSSLLLRQHMIAQLDDALALTGRHLPGPLPVGQQNIDDDPPTGVVEQGA